MPKAPKKAPRTAGKGFAPKKESKWIDGTPQIVKGEDRVNTVETKGPDQDGRGKRF